MITGGQSRIYQGVTSELAGQCGSTIYPCPPEHMDRIREFAGKKDEEYASASLSEFLEKVRRDGKDMGTNLIPLIGHGALRCGVMGYENRKASPEELCALGAVAAKYDGIVTSHMRYQNLRTPEALEEMYEINRRTGAHVHIAHFKASGRAA